MTTTNNALRPVIYGEVLFDMFPDKACLGGAPFNTAWHLRGFGFDPLMVSRVGDDELGEEILEAMRQWGMDTSGVQIDSQHQTGQVKIEMSGSCHSFEILENQAYDHIDQEQAIAALQEMKPALFYHGSLIARTERSMQALAAVRAAAQKEESCITFMDINLRDKCWEHDKCMDLMNSVNWLKINDEELRIMSGDQDSRVREIALRFKEEHDIEALCVTCGADGAFFVCGKGLTDKEFVPVENIVDTVGAGDAFAAVTMMGIMNGWGRHKTLQRALAFASQVCHCQGALIREPHVYRNFLKQWESEDFLSQTASVAKVA